MNETYHEHMIKREKSVVDIAVRVFFVLLCFVPIILIMYISSFVLIVEIGVIALAWYMFVLTDVEFEYLYLSGECQFDKICGKRKRKGCGKIEMEKVEIIAPEDSEELEQYEKQTYKLRDFTSYRKDVDRYVAFQRNNSTLIKVIFEPSEDIINEMQIHSPRKVIIKGQQKKYHV